MAKTSIETSDALRKQAWEERLFRDTVKETYFDRFMGESAESLVQVKSQLEKDQGDKITFGLRMRLSGDGVTGTDILEGNEERLTWYDDSVTLELYRHAVRDRGALDRKRAMFSIDEESRMALKDWGVEKIDKLCFEALEASPTRVMYLDSSGNPQTTTTAATAKSGLHATNSKLTLDFLTFIKTWAKTGGNRTQTPLRPVKVDGKDYFVLLVHPDNLYDLKVLSEWKQAQREARERSETNPLFRNAEAVWNGVIVHEHENVTIATDGGGASVAWSSCTFMGQQSLCWAWGQRQKVVQKKFDYDNENGHAWGIIAKTKKPTFNSKDYGCLGVYLSRTQVSDA